MWSKLRGGHKNNVAVEGQKQERVNIAVTITNKNLHNYPLNPHVYTQFLQKNRTDRQTEMKVIE